MREVEPWVIDRHGHPDLMGLYCSCNYFTLLEAGDLDDTTLIDFLRLAEDKDVEWCKAICDDGAIILFFRVVKKRCWWWPW